MTHGGHDDSSCIFLLCGASFLLNIDAQMSFTCLTSTLTCQLSATKSITTDQNISPEISNFLTISQKDTIKCKNIYLMKQTIIERYQTSMK